MQKNMNECQKRWKTANNSVPNKIGLKEEWKDS